MTGFCMFMNISAFKKVCAKAHTRAERVCRQAMGSFRASAHRRAFLFDGKGTFLSNKKAPPPEVNLPKTVLLSGPPGARTLDTLIKSQVLYQLS